MCHPHTHTHGINNNPPVDDVDSLAYRRLSCVQSLPKFKGNQGVRFHSADDGHVTQPVSSEMHSRTDTIPAWGLSSHTKKKREEKKRTDDNNNNKPPSLARGAPVVVGGLSSEWDSSRKAKRQHHPTTINMPSHLVLIESKQKRQKSTSVERDDPAHISHHQSFLDYEKEKEGATTSQKEENLFFFVGGWGRKWNEVKKKINWLKTNRLIQ